MDIVSDVREFRGIVTISTDSGATLRIRRKHFALCPVAPGDAIDAEAYVDFFAAKQFADAYEAALSSLDACARTAKELERSLRSKGYVDPAIASVVCRLRENGLIDDQRLANRLAESNAGKAVGVYAMKRKMRAKGISDEDSADALAAFDDTQQAAAACKAAEKLARRYEGLPLREARGKLSQALARRGFAWDAVRTAVDKAFGDGDFEEE